MVVLIYLTQGNYGEYNQKVKKARFKVSVALHELLLLNVI
jgi:hypothetical protein